MENGLTMYQQPVQQELILMMNEAAFAGNKQKSAQEKEETKDNFVAKSWLLNLLLTILHVSRHFTGQHYKFKIWLEMVCLN